jgi:hypothetical protein
VRLGELVTAEVVRAGGGGALDADPVTAVRAIREQASVLEAYIQASVAPGSPDV